MERNQIVGFVLIFVILMVWSFLNKPTPEELEAARLQKEAAKIEQVESTQATTDTRPIAEPVLPDSVRQAAQIAQMGSWGASAQGTSEIVTLSNDELTIAFDTKGGRPIYAEIQDREKEIYAEKEVLLSKEKVKLFEDEKNKWNIRLDGASGIVNTDELFFTPELRGNTLTLKAKSSAGATIEQKYTLDDGYNIEYDITFNGLNNELRTDPKFEVVNYLDKIEHNHTYEIGVSTVYYKRQDKDSKYCNCRGDDVKEVNDEKIEWISMSNQFFNTSFIAKDRLFSNMIAETEVYDETNDDLKKTNFIVDIPFNGSSSETFAMDLYMGPNEFKSLKTYDNGLEQIIPFGRSIFGTINRYIIRPAFNFLEGFIGNKGIVIIVLIFIIKMLLYPLTYKMLHSQAKMGALKPQLAGLKDKYKDEPQKAQMETMKVYREYGVSPLGGCMPMFIQMPIWYALFRFFPSSITFRQESFLWANDLSSYDVLFNLPFEIPMFGAHVSLFTILWAITTVIYTYYNTQHMDMSAQPAMKYVQYMMPLMFFAFFNKYASGLTCYMFFSQLFTIAQTVITKKFVFDDEKLLAELNKNKEKPKKKNSFMQKLQEAQERQQKMQNQKQAQAKKKTRKK